jgi:hypothetical protein
VIAPWTNFWNANIFIDASPSLYEVLDSPFVRGAVSGVGAITVLAGVGELATAIVARYRDESAEPKAEP